MKSLFDQALDLNLEFEADRLGADVCSRVGYDPNGVRRYLLTLQSLGEMRWIPFWSPPILLTRSVWTRWMSNLQKSAPAKGSREEGCIQAVQSVPCVRRKRKICTLHHLSHNLAARSRARAKISASSKVTISRSRMTTSPPTTTERACKPAPPYNRCPQKLSPDRGVGGR